MNNLKQELEKTAREEITSGNFKGSIKIEEFNEKPNFSGEINLQESEIHEKFNPEYEEKNPGKSKIIIKDITRHEINHTKFEGFSGCPRNIDAHTELIIEPIASVLAEKSYNPADIHYIANVLEDTILHTDLSKGFSLDGIVHFFDDVGSTSKNYTNFYEAHTKLNLYLFGSSSQKRTLKKYFKNQEKVRDVLKTFLEKTGIKNLKQKLKINGKELEIKDRNKIREFLNDKNNWKEISRIYAEEFSKLMEPGYALPIFNHSGKGTKGKGVNIPIPFEGNQFDKEMESSEYKKKRIQKAHVNNEETPKWMDSFEALDLLYQSLAQKLNIKVETFKKQSTFPLTYYGKRTFNPEKDSLKHISFGFDENGNVELKKKKYHEDMPLEYKIKEKGFPEVRFGLLDTSGTMKLDTNGGDNKGNTKIIPWGDNSRYHFGLLAWYGLLEYLKQNHLLKQTNIILGNFSDKTYIGNGLREAKETALNPQFGDTTIDMDEVRNFFKKQDMLVFTISDGQIDNWNNIKEEFISLAKQHHYFHLQIGPKNEMTKYLEKEKLYVSYIKNAKDLGQEVIDLTDALYRGTKK